MDGPFNPLIAAAVSFVCGHFLLSSRPLRQPLRSRLGEGAFLGAYSLLALGALVWMISAYGQAPFVLLWDPPLALRWVPVLVMPLACVLVILGLTSPNPTMVGGEKIIDDAVIAKAQGIQTITRHPFLWGTTLWALSHLCVRGDLASIILMGAILVLSLGGMHHIDLRREASLGAAWGPIKLTTSALPFAAALSGRTSVDWQGIGWLRPAGGLALYIALVFLHGPLIGVAVMPH